MPNLRFPSALLATAALLSVPVSAQVAVPEALRDWQGWALQGQEFRRCPLLTAADPASAESYRCAWPGKLELRTSAGGAQFTQRWQVFADSWIELPGDATHWPSEVRSNGAPIAVVARNDRPFVRLSAGSVALSGVFAWTQRPQQLPLASRTALVELTLNGVRVARPVLSGDALVLGATRAANEARALNLQVYRLVRDDLPVRLITRIRLQVAGPGREEVLARVLPQGFAPVSLESGLAARLDADGRLRVQLRPGIYELTLDARGTSVATELTRPAPGAAPWARDEIWSFEGVDRLRIAVAEGVESVDPRQVDVPGEWQGLPAFRMAADSTLKVVERSRGLSAADDNRLTLSRGLWLDFDHGGYTAVDTISGQMRRDWRLDMQAPFVLASARVGEDALLVTRGAKPDESGVELRSPNVSFTAASRIEGTRQAMSATGWIARFENVNGVLNLPPGHMLLAAYSDGADIAPGSWWSQWGLWSLFGVAIVVAFTLRVIGRNAALIALLALLLSYTAAPEMIWLWANVLAAIALARAVPEGRLRRWAQGYRLLSLIVLVAALLPFAWSQVRLALHPQLDSGAVFDAGLMAGRRDIAAIPPAAQAPAAMEEKMEVAIDAARERVNLASVAAPPMPSQESYPAVSSLQRYAPGTLLQTGPGLPAWRYSAYSFSWSGPVEAADQVRFIYLGPVMSGIWRLAMVALLVGWFLLLLRAAFGIAAPSLRGLWSKLGMRSSAAALLLALLVVSAPSAFAQATPGADTLNALRERLLQPPPCAPSCVEINRARVTVSGDRLEVTLQVSALTNAAVALPSAADRWQIDAVTVDGGAAITLAREAGGALWAPLASGVRTLRMSGSVAGSDSVQLQFPQLPRVVAVDAAGWDVAGVNEARLVAGSIELTRRAPAGARPAADRGASDAGADFPAFGRATRTFDLGVEWTIGTQLQRVAPLRGAANFEVPLVPGESVLTEGVKVREARAVVVGLNAGEEYFGWSSALAQSATLTLEHAAGRDLAEVWNFRVHPQWRVAFEGMPSVLPDDTSAGDWLFSFYPRPGETLRLAISRPEAVAGATLAIDSAAHVLRVGTRTSDASLSFRYRSTQGGRHTIALPPQARVQSVTADGVALQLRPEPSGELSLNLLPGSHDVAVNYQLPDGGRLRTTPPAVDLRAPASNVQTTLELPRERWALLSLDRDGGVGPAILYWSELAAFIVLALALGRWPGSPIRTREWLLLGLGLSTLSWSVFLVMALWFGALRWRESWEPTSVPRWTFNLVQLSLVLLSVFALTGLTFSGIRYGFFSTPDMGVAGPGSAGNSFGWFADRTVSALPQPVVFSVPLWIYKLLVLAWAFWIAYAIALRWLPWAWRAWTARGFWRGKESAR